MATIDKPNFRLVTASGGEKNVITWQNDQTVNGFMRIRWRGIPDGLPQLNLTGMKANVEGFIAGLTAPVADRAVVYGQDEAGEVHVLPEQHGSETVDFIEQQLGGAAFVGPLDGLTATSDHAWSVARRLTGGYSGSLIRLREDGGDTEQDFGFVANGDLDTAAITTFLGANNGFITTVYDQVGAVNWTQTTNADQPPYLASGVGGKPTADFDGTSDHMLADAAAASFAGTDVPYTVLQSLVYDDMSAGNNYPWQVGNSAGNNPFGAQWATGSRMRVIRVDDGGSTRDATDGGPQTSGLQRIVLTRYDGADNVLLRQDGVQLMNETGYNLGPHNPNRLTMAARRRSGAPDNFRPMEVSETIIFSSAISVSDYTSLENDMRTYYNTL